MFLLVNVHQRVVVDARVVVGGDFVAALPFPFPNPIEAKNTLDGLIVTL